jgi:asparagine synthase (glutamine-hydrolysing)
MCGIAGIINKHQKNVKAELTFMTDRLSSRGPDDQGFFMDSNVNLGHRRLSIIDLSSGHQPMFSEDESVVIVFNGEIYNYRSLRDELIRSGHSFRTESDTEVIIKGYEVYGIRGIIERLEGMFAFALFDRKSKTVFIVRDRFGEKPLYYLHNENGFYFASELKALIPFLQDSVIDKEALNLYLTLTYIPAPFTIYKNIKKLPAGSFLKIEPGDVSINIEEYYSLKTVIQLGKGYDSYEAAKKDLRDLMFHSVNERMISDVPLGAFLSGGIDSSIVSAIMSRQSCHPINTFSIGFKEKSYDESERAALVAKHINSNHTLHIIDHNDLLKIADDVVDYFDEPFGDSSSLPSFMVAKKAREKVTVVLTGDCADELFGGYEKYLGHYYAKKYKALPSVIRSLLKLIISSIPHSSKTNHFLRKVKKILTNADLNPFDLHYNLMSLGFNDNERGAILRQPFHTEIKPFIKKLYDSIPAGKDLMDKGFYTDVMTVLEGDMLAKVDRMCMANSLEARVPFLDSKIVTASFRMPVNYKIQGTSKKKILKDTFKYLLPKEVFKFSKKGFGVPIALWFRNELKNEIEQALERSRLEEQEIFDANEVQKMLTEHITGKENHASKLWCLYVFQKWYHKNILKGSEKVSSGSNRTW